MSQIPRLKGYAGPALLSYGFRPFFLLGSIWSGLQVMVWLPMFFGEVSVPTAFAPRDWHAHEMLFGYVAAVVAGFLLTAIPNWTGRLPLQGTPLLVLLATWLAGRLAVALSATTGWLAALVIDAAFLVLMIAAVAREIVAGKNWRNAKIVALLGLLGGTNIAFHLEAHLEGAAYKSAQLAIATVVMLIMVVGGRIVPSFTRNWLMRQQPGMLPAPVGRFDRACLAISGVALVVWIYDAESLAAAILLAAAGAANTVRLARWAGHRTAGDRLVFILHLAFGFLPLGFALLAMAAFQLIPQSAGIHAWTTGAMGTMTLAVMSRASLGHTGRPLQASPQLQAVYALALAAAVARILAAMVASWSVALLHVAGFAWATAFLGFAVLYAPVLAGRGLASTAK